MKESEFYLRAFRDAAFRHEKLGDLRYAKMVIVGLLWFSASVGAAFWLYAGLREGRWDAGFGFLVPLTLCGGNYSTCVTRIAALEAIEDASKPRHGVLPEDAEATEGF